MTKLADLIAKAKNVQMSEEDKEAQRRSFAYGNAHIENKLVTREMIAKAADHIANKK